MSKASLNPAQSHAVNHLEGPLLVLAGPGSGKTRVVTHRIARLIRRGVPPDNILAVTFTNKAAKEMRERVRKLTKKKGKGLTIATFHSACARLLRIEIEALGYRPNFTIYDQGNQQSLMRTILRDIDGAGSTRSASAVLAGIGDRKNLHPSQLTALTPAALTPAAPTPAAAADDDDQGTDNQQDDEQDTELADAEAAFFLAASERYQSELRHRNAVDFDDLILLTARLFREHADVLERWRERYQFILVDEYQDTNRAQDEILTLLAGTHRNLCVVGDDDQSIYGWRGGELELILGFERRWPGATVVKLEQNYRSRAHIVDAANGLIAKNPKRHPKQLFTARGPGETLRLVELEDEEEEAEFIADEIARAARNSDDPRRTASDYAVLFRTNEQMRPLEQALRGANVPYRLLGGRSFFDRKEVVDVVGYLRLAVNRQDEEALMRVVNTPSRGLGARSIDAVRTAARAVDADLWPTLVEASQGASQTGLTPRAQEAIKSFVDVVESITAVSATGSPTLITDLLESIDYRGEIDRTYKDPNVQATRWNLTLELSKSWQTYCADADPPSLQGFLDAIALNHNDDDDDDGLAGVTLATVHASKGLEFPNVFVAGLEEGFFPHKRSVDDGRELAEERRVLFVAITRAQERLTLSWARTRMLRGKATPTVRSRFLDDLPEACATTHDPNAPASPEAARDHLAKLRELLGR